jgi:hypothetical protein
MTGKDSIAHKGVGLPQHLSQNGYRNVVGPAAKSIHKHGDDADDRDGDDGDDEDGDDDDDDDDDPL